MRVTYDPSVDAAYIYLVEKEPGAVDRSEEYEPDDMGGTMVLDFDSAGHLLGIEVLRARERLPGAVLEQADRR
jgi:uncharacterized protein YuzE